MLLLLKGPWAATSQPGQWSDLDLNNNVWNHAHITDGWETWSWDSKVRLNFWILRSTYYWGQPSDLVAFSAWCIIVHLPTSNQRSHRLAVHCLATHTMMTHHYYSMLRSTLSSSGDLWIWHGGFHQMIEPGKSSAKPPPSKKKGNIPINRPLFGYDDWS